MTSISQSWYIYGIRSGDDPYRYVGLTTKRPQDRLRNHIYDSSRFTTWPLYRWMANNNSDDLFIDVLELCPVGDEDHLYAAETYWIEFYRNLQGSLENTKTDFYLLNVLDGGRCGRLGKKHTEETKAKMRAGHAARGPRNYTHSEESRIRRSESMKGREFTEEHREKLSQAKLGNTQSRYALHVRHHVNKNKHNPNCTHCPDLTPTSDT